VFPEGKYYCAPLNIRSNTFIYLRKGAEIIGSNNRWDYPIIPAYTEDGTAVNASWEGEPNDSFMSLISSFDSHDIMLVGEGTINGNADKADWWFDHRTRRGAWRPNNFFVNRCENVSLVGLNIINSPCWNLHPFYSDKLDFINLTLRSVPTSPNTDGFDPESCRDMRLLGTQIFVGDDCIAIKSGKKIMADRFYRPTENLEIRNCEFTRCGIGSMMANLGAIVIKASHDVGAAEYPAGVHDSIAIRNCHFHDNGTRGVYASAVRGLTLENNRFERNALSPDRLAEFPDVRMVNCEDVKERK
jgi:polygalacturonase